MKNRQYWLERGKDGPKKEGYVCLGIGNRKNCLASQLKVEVEEIYSQRHNDFYPNWEGSYDDYFYYLTSDKFNQLFPENQNMKYVIKPLNTAHSKAIQERLFEIGFQWVGSGRTINKYSPIYVRDGILCIDGKGGEEEITLDDLYKDDFFFKPIEVKLNKDYTAVVHKDKIVVGCQTFSMETFDELAKAVKKTRNS